MQIRIEVNGFANPRGTLQSESWEGKIVLKLKLPFSNKQCDSYSHLWPNYNLNVGWLTEIMAYLPYLVIYGPRQEHNNSATMAIVDIWNNWILIRVNRWFQKSNVIRLWKGVEYLKHLHFTFQGPKILTSDSARP